MLDKGVVKTGAYVGSSCFPGDSSSIDCLNVFRHGIG